MTAILKGKKLRHKEIMDLSKVRAGKWWVIDPNLGHMVLGLLTTVPHCFSFNKAIRNGAGKGTQGQPKKGPV